MHGNKCGEGSNCFKQKIFLIQLYTIQENDSLRETVLR